jgi:hypothetical protein
MKIKNISKKLIHIGKTPLMPGDETTVADSVAQTPAIQVLTKQGMLELIAEKKAKAAGQFRTSAKGAEQAENPTKSEEQAKTSAAK